MRLSTDFVNCSVSSNTMTMRDLLTAYADFIENTLDPQDDLAWELRHWAQQDDENHGEWNGVAHDEAAHMLLDDCHNLFDDIAPEGTYFGAHEGNMSDYGFWSYEEEPQDPNTPDPRDVADFEASGYFDNPAPGSF